MKVTRSQSIREDWDQVRSWNYKLPLKNKMSVVYAELDGIHGEVKTNDFERVYYILDGVGEYQIGDETIKVEKDDVITIPPQTIYNYKPLGTKTLKILLFMELWDN